MMKTCKERFLARLNAAWTVSKDRPIDVKELDGRAWEVTYKHRETGKITVFPLLKSELRRQESNMRVHIQ